MTLQDFVMNWHDNSNISTKITIEDATKIIGSLSDEDREGIDDLTPETFMETWNDIIDMIEANKDMVKVDFFVETSLDGSDAYNYLSALTEDGLTITARCHWPEGKEEDYGYLALVRAFRDVYLNQLNRDPDDLIFPYGEDAILSEDASAETEVETEVSNY